MKSLLPLMFRFITFLTVVAFSAAAKTSANDKTLESAADLHEFPWIARIVSYFVTTTTPVNGETYKTCSATLIAERWLLTTAKCVTNNRRDVATSVLVRLGRFDLKAAWEPGEDISIARGIYRHPNFTDGSNDYDFALIKLPRPLAWTYQVRPIRLPNLAQDCSGEAYGENDLVVDKCYSGSVVGWGKLQQQTLKTMKLDMQPFSFCSNQLQLSSNDSFQQRTKLCAGGQDRQKACSVADQGAPFACRTSANGERILIGVRQQDDSCDTVEIKPTLFSRVCSVLPWIDAKLVTRPTFQNLNLSGSAPIRLTGDVTINNATMRGFVEVYYNNTWGTVCGDSFTRTAADVVCRQLGFPSGLAHFDNALDLAPSALTRPVWLEDVVCRGNESSLATCNHLPFGTRNCRHSDDVAVSCWSEAFNASFFFGEDARIRNGQVRLVESGYNGTGFVEVYWNGRWGTICDDSFDNRAAQIVCKQLGFGAVNPGRVITETSMLPRSRATATLLDDVQCNGREARISDCLHRAWGESDCGHSEDVAVNCKGLSTSQSSRVTSSPEWVNEPGTPGQVRLTGSITGSNNTGFVEVFWNGRWGTVCDDNFDTNAARVVCRQLGFGILASRYGTSLPNLRTSSATLIWLDDVMCGGGEPNLASCGHREWGENNCGHDEDVAISCDGRADTAFNETSFLGQIRLTGSPSNSSGFVEVFWNGRWGTVCDDLFDNAAARVVCRQLGFGTDGARVETSRAFFQPSSTPNILLDDVVCNGNEASLSQCRHLQWGMHNCGRNEDVAISCQSSLSQGNASMDGQIRLTGSSVNSTGFVEVYWNGRWGTVCDDLFDANAARVVCRQLGFGTYNARVAPATYLIPSTATLIHLDDVSCSGYEEKLADCNHREWGVNNCGTSENVAVSCLAETAISSSYNSTGPYRNGDLRLVGSTWNHTGFLELFWNGRWGTVCDDGFTNLAAQVACRQLGFETLQAKIVNPAGLTPPAETTIWLDEAFCYGNEIGLLQCRHKTVGVHNCDHNEDVVISCVGEAFNETIGSGRVRLTGSPLNSTGFVEVFWNGRWGTVCDDFFDNAAARVVCRQLGFGTSEAQVQLSRAGLQPSWSSNILLDDVSCYGNESTLTQCRHSRWGTHNCDHSEDVAVTCQSSLDGQIRLTGSSVNSTGFVEVNWNGRWGTVCDDGFDTNAARVVCRQLGFGTDHARLATTTRLTPSSAIIIHYISCRGHEDRLGNCNHDEWGQNSCSFSEIVAVSCLSEAPGYNASGVNNNRDIGLVGSPWNQTEGVQGQVRLAGAKLSNSTGFVEVFWNGRWGTVCDDLFDNAAAKVVCRQLGFGASEARIETSRAFLLPSSTPNILLDDVVCNGNEANLTQCRHSQWGMHNCGRNEDVAISCQPSLSQGNSSMDGQIRLSGSSINSTGFVEVYWNGRWGTVCDDGFDTNAARVVCRQLGFGTGYARIASTAGLMTSSATLIFLDDISCNGVEDKLANCQHREWGENNCGVSENVAVSCLAETAISSSYNSTGPYRNGDLRLVGSTWNHTGFLELFWNGRWGTVCDDGFSTAATQVACHQLGFDTTQARIVESSGLILPMETTIWLDETICYGNEMTLLQCRHNDLGVHNCGHSEDVAISCLSTTSSVVNSASAPGVQGQVRLTGSSMSPNSTGFVEIFWNGQWGTVCDDDFEQIDAQVVCRQLGFSPAQSRLVTSVGLHSSRATTIWLDNVRCSGIEQTLQQCSHNGWGINNCGHSEDVAIACYDASKAQLGGNNGQVRLTGSNSNDTGYVEIYWLGQWGAVCDDFFTNEAAAVVCRQLGFNDPSQARILETKSGLAQSLSTTIWLDGVRCNGVESALSDCLHRPWGENNCGRTEDVAVTCRMSQQRQHAITTTADLNEELFTAIKSINPQQVEAALRRGASPNAKTSSCCSYTNPPALICAACLGPFRSALLLVANGAALETLDNDGGTALIWTARAGFVDIVRLLLQSGANINARTSRNNDTALTWAAYSGQLEIARLLVQNGADIKQRTFSGSNAVDLARSNNYLDLARYLEDVTPSLTRNTTLTPMDTLRNNEDRLFSAITTVNASQVDFLLKQGASANAQTSVCCRDHLSAPALVCAACVGSSRIVELLIAKNGEVNVGDRYNNTPLIAAARAGFVDVVNLLLRKGAKVNAAGSANSDTALTWAAFNGNFDCVRALVEAGANIGAITKSGNNATNLARTKGYSNIATYLESRNLYSSTTTFRPLNEDILRDDKDFIINHSRFNV